MPPPTFYVESNVPALIYDGECGICREWVDYWRRRTGAAVAYRSWQEAATDHPSIPVEAFRSAIKLMERNGSVLSGAAASFAVLSYGDAPAAGWWCYRHLPGFAAASEWAYGVLSRRRALLAVATRLLWGLPLVPPSHDLVRWLFLRGIGAIYLAAFASLAVQIPGLVGSDGILPLAPWLAAAQRALGHDAWWRLPTVFWLAPTDGALVTGTVAGIVLAALVVIGVAERTALAALFVLYLSCTVAGQVFMEYQWDALLLETGFLAIFVAGRSRLGIWLGRWLAFRYFFMAGAAKLVSGDPTWRNLTALDYHFWTQPLPTPLAWYAAKLPPGVLALATAAALVVEAGLIFLVFAPRRLRAVCAFGLIGFQCAIFATGNYNFFNLLSMLLCLFLFDDKALACVLPGRVDLFVRHRAVRASRGATIATVALALVVIPVGLDRVVEQLWQRELPVADAIADAISPLMIVNPYGLFANMTTSRPEIIVEGSDDGEHWREYRFRDKPGPVTRAPSWNIPHQPRLDWQMWFAALQGPRTAYWFDRFLVRLLQGSPSVLGLLGVNPFPAHPPRYVRALLYDYRFSDRALRHETGAWWTRRLVGIYLPRAHLANQPSG